MLPLFPYHTQPSDFFHTKKPPLIFFTSDDPPPNFFSRPPLLTERVPLPFRFSSHRKAPFPFDFLHVEWPPPNFFTTGVLLDLPSPHWTRPLLIFFSPKSRPPLIFFPFSFTTEWW
ncbi:hypothetical protein Csa_018368 [Cucumis sativus]|nr:hypothetical protein Csa_018368 [Cucumis sativus]